MNAVLAVVSKDLRVVWRDRVGWLTTAAFATASVLTYTFAFDLVSRDVRPLLPGLLWTTFLFAGIFASSQAFQREVEAGTLDAMLISPVPASVIFLGKVLSSLLALLAIEVALLVLATILFDTTLITLELTLIVLVGTAGYVSLTTLLSTMGSRLSSRAMILPVLALPLLVPMLIGAVRATGGALDLPVGTAPWTLLLVVFAVWSSLAGALLFPLAVER
jgi:heme exporter protein B